MTISFTRPLLVILCLLLAADVLAQQPGVMPGNRGAEMQGLRIVGRVVDADTSEPLEMATVALYQNDEFITGAATTATGTFEVGPLRPGTYEVRISSIGFESHVIPEVRVTPAAATDLGTIHLVFGTALLDEAIVEAERDFMETRADRTVYNVSDDPLTGGSDAIEVLETLPSLEVDIDGTISLRGNQNVAVHINGRPVPMSGDQLTAFLRQLPGDQLERVEVIPNPSARYEANSMAGIVNIVLKENVDRGLSGSVRAGGGTNPSANFGGNVAYQRGKLDTYVGYGFRMGQWGSTSEFFRESFVGNNPITIQDSEQESDNYSHFMNGSLNYTLQPRLTLFVQAYASLRDNSSENIVSNRILDNSNVQTDGFNRLRTGSNSGLNGNVTLGVRQAWTPHEHELTAEIEYSLSSNEDDENYDQTFFLNRPREFQRNYSENVRNDISARVDYQRPLGEDGRMELGARAEFETMDNDLNSSFRLENGDWMPYPGRTNSFMLNETVTAGYVQVAHPVGPLNLQAGLRVEHATVDFSLSNTGEEFDRSYTGVFPSLFASYEYMDGGTIRGGYTRRVNRPRSNQLNPFESFVDSLNVYRGNPFLDPEYTDSYEITLTQFLPFGTIMLNPFYRRSTDMIRQRTTYDPETNVRLTRPENLAKGVAYGTELTFSVRSGRRLNASVSGSLFRDQMTAEDLGLSTDNMSWSVRGNVSAQLLPGLSAQMFGMYRAPRQEVDSKSTGWRMMSIGLRQQLFDDRAAIGIRFHDPFNWGRRESSSWQYFPGTDDYLYFQEGWSQWQSQHISITFGYNFGRPQQRPQQAPEQNEEMPPPDGQNGGGLQS